MAAEMSSGAEPNPPAFQTAEMHSKMCKKIAQLVKLVDSLFRDGHDYQLSNVTLREELSAVELIRSENKSLREEVLTLKAYAADLQKRHKLELDQLKVSHQTEVDSLQQKFKREICPLEEQLASRNKLIKKMEKALWKKIIQVKDQTASFQEESRKLGAALDQATKHSRDLKEQQQTLLESVDKHTISEAELQKSHDAVIQKNNSLLAQIRYLSSLSRAPKKSPKRFLLPQRKEAFPADVFMGVDSMDELRRLRSQVHWYRLELVNRESTYNRMFVEQLPVTVGSQSKRSVSSPKTTAKSVCPARKTASSAKLVKRT